MRAGAARRRGRKWFLFHAFVFEDTMLRSEGKYIKLAYVSARATLIYLLTVGASRLSINESGRMESKNQNHCVLTIRAMIGLKN